MKYNFEINNIDEMIQFGKKIASIIKEEKGVILLDGDLGAGKTTLTKVIAKSLGINDVVTSPTFNIFKRYEFDNSALNHFDLYRIKSNVYDQGFEDYWDNEDEINIIEWSIYLPDEFKKIFKINIYIKIIDENKREIILQANKEIISKLED